MNEKNYSGDIAVVGISCNFPMASDKEAFWSNLVSGVDSVVEIPKSRLNYEKRFTDNMFETNGKTYSKWLGVLDNIDKFDNDFFDISPKEAEKMDPHQRLLLEQSWKCIEDSGIALSELRNKRTSVCVGSLAYNTFWKNDPTVILGIEDYYFLIANRVSYFLGLHGESFTVDTGCSSSFVALNAAYNSIITDSSDYALVGGVNVHRSYRTYASYSKSKMLSPTGKCHTFDVAGDGFVSGEGAAFILIQPLEKAIKANNKIYCVIKACAVNHGGHAHTITAPNVAAQTEVIREAYRKTDFTPDTVTYIETHGTGTSLGDPIEIEALKQAFRPYTKDIGYCKVGSVKTNVGHLEGCAALGSLIKIIMMMKYKTIPASIHLNNVNPVLNIKDTPFVLCRKNTPWNRKKEDIPLRAGISSFGLGGTNSHVLVEEYVGNKFETAFDQKKRLFVLSAKTEKSLEQVKHKWKELISNNKLSEDSLRDISYTLLKGREHFKYRFSAVVSSISDIYKVLDGENSSQKKDYCLCFSEGTDKIVFSENIKSSPAFIQAYEQVRNQLEESKLALEILDKVISGDNEEIEIKINNFIAELILFYALKAIGISVKAVAGYGSGFYTSLAASESTSLTEALSALSNDSEVVSLTRPNIKWYNSSSGSIVYPHSVNIRTLEDMIHNITLDKAACEELIEKSKTLYQYQYTYKKYINEWESVTEAWGGPVKMMEKVRLAKKDEFKANPAQAILVLMIISSLTRVNKKWMLEDERTFSSDNLYFISDMLTSGVLTKEDFVNLAISNISLNDYEKIADNINIALNNSDSLFDNEVVRSGNIDISASSAKSDSMEHIPNSMTVIEISGKTVSFKDKDIYSIDDTLDIANQLWKDGHNINWEKFFGDCEYNKADIPLYCFDHKTFPSESVVEETSVESISEKADSDKFRQYVPVWKNFETSAASLDLNGDILVFSNSNEKLICDIIKSKYPSAAVSYADIHKINDSPEEIICILKENTNINKILYFTDDIDKGSGISTEELKNAQESAVYSVHKLVKCLSEAGCVSRKLEISFITFGNFIINDEPYIPSEAALHGICKSISKEFRNWDIISCDLDSSWNGEKWNEKTFRWNIEYFLENHKSLAYGCENAIHGGIAYKKLLEKVEVSDTNKSLFKDKGVYVIIGGAGGVGYLTATHLAKRYNASIVIIGRSEYSIKQLDKITELNSYGGDSIYISADMNDISSLESAKLVIKEKYGRINGVIHSAIDLSDHLLINTDEADFRKGTAPKIEGTINMCEVFSDIVDNFILFYSSIESYLSLAGQGNYISGCCFQDSYSDYLNRNRTYDVRTINWGFWGEVGVASSQRYYDQFGSIGLWPITNEDGIKMLETAFASSHTQMVLFNGTDGLVDLLPVYKETVSNENNDVTVSNIITLAAIEKITVNAITEVLGISEDDFDNEMDLFDIGIDSINEFETIVIINKSLGINLQPTDLINCLNINEFVDYVGSIFFKL